MPQWIDALLPHLTDEELIQLAEAIKAEMNERVILADSGPIEG